MQIPSEQKLEKPHKAYVAITVDFSYIMKSFIKSLSVKIKK